MENLDAWGSGDPKSKTAVVGVKEVDWRLSALELNYFFVWEKVPFEEFLFDVILWITCTLIGSSLDFLVLYYYSFQANSSQSVTMSWFHSIRSVAGVS